MFDKKLCLQIGELLKKADELQLQYYQINNRMSKDDVPKELIGSKCLTMILNRPKEGLKFLNQKADPFARFCDSQRKKQAKDWSTAYGIMMKYKQLLEEVLERVDNEKMMCDVSTLYRNIITMEYLIERN